MNSNRSDCCSGSLANTPIVIQTSGSEKAMEVINVSAALARMGGDSGLLADVAGFFLEDAPELMSQMRVAVRDHQGGELAHAAHTLKGLASNFDAVFVQKLAAELESRGFAGRFEGADSMLEELDREASRVELALKEQVLGSQRS